MSDQIRERMRALANAIENLPTRIHVGRLASASKVACYKEGHRDARHAAAELVSAAVPALVQPEPTMQQLAAGAFYPQVSGFASPSASQPPSLPETVTDAQPTRWHELKTDPDVFDAVADGRKPFEIRLNDRDFRVGDGLRLRRTRDTGWAMKNTGAPLVYTGETCERVVTYVLHGPQYGLADGWVIMSLAHIGKRPAMSEARITWAHEVGGWWRLELNGKTVSEHKREADFKIARDRLIAALSTAPAQPTTEGGQR